MRGAARSRSHRGPASRATRLDHQHNGAAVRVGRPGTWVRVGNVRRAAQPRRRRGLLGHRRRHQISALHIALRSRSAWHLRRRRQELPHRHSRRRRRRDRDSRCRPSDYDCPGRRARDVDRARGADPDASVGGPLCVRNGQHMGRRTRARNGAVVGSIRRAGLRRGGRHPSARTLGAALRGTYVVGAVPERTNAMRSRRLRAGGNRSGADSVLVAQTGYPCAVDFSADTCYHPHRTRRGIRTGAHRRSRRPCPTGSPSRSPAPSRLWSAPRQQTTWARRASSSIPAWTGFTRRAPPPHRRRAVALRASLRGLRSTTVFVP